MHRNEMSLGTGDGIRRDWLCVCSSHHCEPVAEIQNQKCTSLTSVGVAALLCALPCIGGGVHASRSWPFGAAHPRSAIMVFTISSICSRHVWRQSCGENFNKKLVFDLYNLHGESLHKMWVTKLA